MILDSATVLFAECGYGDADTQTLADRLGVGKGTLYRYFPSKRELFLAATDRVMRRMRQYVYPQCMAEPDPLKRVALFTRCYLEFFADHPECVELLIQERALFKDRKTPTFIEHRARRLGQWREVYRSLIAEGRLRDMPVDRITDVVGHLIYGTMFTNYFTGCHDRPAAQADDIMDIVFHGILSDGERASRVEPTRESSPP